jgi:Trypsin
VAPFRLLVKIGGESMRSLKWVMLGLGISAFSCSGSGEGPTEGTDSVEIETNEEAIVRATSQGGRNEAVMLRVKFVTNTGGIGTRTCSGSYFAPRVVLTAAHCLTDVYVNQVFVYYGDNLAADEAQLTAQGSLFFPPAPGSPSKWAKADSFELNPAYDANLNSADMAVVYLDRKLPFDPMPLARFNIDSSYNNKLAVFSGWGGDAAPTPFTATGSGVQRTGKTVLKGAPTAADYYADDPNLGMLDAAVRATVFKTDGRAPNSNGCFGDSGGPIFINKYGQDYIAGVNYWTGLSCADYNLWTRIDPYLPFLDQAYKRGGQDTLIPRLTCVAPNGNGKYLAYFGYNNKNGVAVTVPYGAKNSLALDSSNTRPSTFIPGDYALAFSVGFNSNQTLTYKLSPDNSPTTTVTATKNSPACPATFAGKSCTAGCKAQTKSGCPGSNSFEACTDYCQSFYDFTTEYAQSTGVSCTPELDAYYACVAGTPTGTENWACFDGLPPDSPACYPELYTFYGCLGF